MKKAALKNRLRRRTADKLYDLDRSTGGVPVLLPTIQPAEAEHQRGDREHSTRAQRRRGRSTTQERE